MIEIVIYKVAAILSMPQCVSSSVIATCPMLQYYLVYMDFMDLAVHCPQKGH